ncbi:TIM barrel protein [Actinoplanes sp. N902-109]|uniref:TIM barrel protein n=1 Tax=Actinoplanes sp. (strain N902-109) TaxID=649831 RepID=UPI0003295AFF|nr:TIM barrel protein [Actinoplanes sp. N902-109]AGL14248.1 myo-inosose-2 dehydratase [Actinoplanes sp. N902-109]
MRIAGAPISWGISEVPGWGHQLPVERVLSEMRDLGLTATEFGPAGFLPSDDLLSSYGLSAVGGFVPVVLHTGNPTVDFDRFVAAGADTVVLAAATGLDGYDARPAMDPDGWRALLTTVDRIAADARTKGLSAVLHPHVGTMIERADEVQRVLDGSAVALCLDTGHLLIGGTDPAELAERAGDRIAHVHAKDVDADLAAEVRTGRRTFTDAVRAGMFRPIGDGDVDFDRVAKALRRHGYAGWWVLEQDTILTGAESGARPAADVRRSIDRLRAICTA